VKIVCNARIAELVTHPKASPGTERVAAVRLADGSDVPADFVLVAIGVAPTDALAREAGLDCDNGIVVNEFCRTSDASIWAAGDCTSHPSIHFGMRVRLESVDHAFEQGASAALNMLGIATVHDKVPWFWSDQFDLKMVIVGLADGHDAVVLRGDPASRAFSVCYLKNGELIAVETVNHTKDQMAARKLIPVRARPDPAKLGDADTPLKETL
jgi:3-phenylpropionate/trans-cinnamate dioxygenase ferredoxin reductase subunit